WREARRSPRTWARQRQPAPSGAPEAARASLLRWPRPARRRVRHDRGAASPGPRAPAAYPPALVWQREDRAVTRRHCVRGSSAPHGTSRGPGPQPEPDASARVEETVTEIALRAEGLYKVFGRQPQEAVERLRAGASRDEVRPATAAVIDASFEVRRGEIFVVMGLSGSGKSTLIRMLNGLLDATAGEVEICGERLTGASAAQVRGLRRRRVSMVFQHFALLPHRTVLDNVAYALEVRGVAKDERLEAARRTVDLVGLSCWE